MKTLVILQLVFVLAASDKVTNYKECSDGPIGAIQSLEINAACSSDGCLLQRNHNVTFSATFKNGQAITEAKTVVYGILFGAIKIPDPFPGMPPNACQNIVGGCPVAAGSSSVYSATVFVQPVYPQLRVVAQWELHDQNDHKVFCFVMPVQITA